MPAAYRHIAAVSAEVVVGLRWLLRHLFGGTQLRQAFRKGKSSRPCSIVDSMPEENTPLWICHKRLLDPFEVVVGRQKIVVEKCDDVRATKRQFKAEVALGGKACPAEHGGNSEALRSVRIEVGSVRCGEDNLIGRPCLCLQMPQQLSNKLRSACRSDDDNELQGCNPLCDPHMAGRPVRLTLG